MHPCDVIYPAYFFWAIVVLSLSSCDLSASKRIDTQQLLKSSQERKMAAIAISDNYGTEITKEILQRDGNAVEALP